MWLDFFLKVHGVWMRDNKHKGHGKFLLGIKIFFSGIFFSWFFCRFRGNPLVVGSLRIHLQVGYIFKSVYDSWSRACSHTFLCICASSPEFLELKKCRKLVC